VDDEFGVNVRVGVIVGVPVAGFMITTCVVGLGDGLVGEWADFSRCGGIRPFSFVGNARQRGAVRAHRVRTRGPYKCAGLPTIAPYASIVRI
jgi:hypothetical protein